MALAPAPAFAQGKPVKIGLLTVKTGPLAAGGKVELLAISDYAAQAKMPILCLAAAEDMTQRKPNPYFVRASGTSAQYLHPLADYAGKELKFKRVIRSSRSFRATRCCATSRCHCSACRRCGGTRSSGSSGSAR